MKPMTLNELCEWLKDNSSGDYRPSAAILLKQYHTALSSLLEDLENGGEVYGSDENRIKMIERALDLD